MQETTQIQGHYAGQPLELLVTRNAKTVREGTVITNIPVPSVPGGMGGMAAALGSGGAGAVLLAGVGYVMNRRKKAAAERARCAEYSPLEEMHRQEERRYRPPPDDRRPG